MSPRVRNFYGIETNYWDSHTEDVDDETVLCATTSSGGRVLMGGGYVTPRPANFYGIRTNYWDSHTEDVGDETVLCTTTSSGGRVLKKVSIVRIKNVDTVSKWKVVTSSAMGGNHREDTGLANVKILPPRVICSESDLIMRFLTRKRKP